MISISEVIMNNARLENALFTYRIRFPCRTQRYPAQTLEAGMIMRSNTADYVSMV